MTHIHGDHYVLIGGDVLYSEADMLKGNIDGVCIDEKLHQQSTAKMRKLCQIKPTITQFAHDKKREYRLENKVFSKVVE